MVSAPGYDILSIKGFARQFSYQSVYHLLDIIGLKYLTRECNNLPSTRFAIPSVSSGDITSASVYNSDLFALDEALNRICNFSNATKWLTKNNSSFLLVRIIDSSFCGAMDEKDRHGNPDGIYISTRSIRFWMTTVDDEFHSLFRRNSIKEII